MEKFITILSLSSQASVDIACDTLEGAGIPVMIEHIQAEDQIFKILVPARYQQRATALTVGLDCEPVSAQRTRARRFSGEWLSKQGLITGTV